MRPGGTAGWSLLLVLAGACAPHGVPVAAPRTVATAVAHPPRDPGTACRLGLGPRAAVPVRHLPSADAVSCDRLPPGVWGHAMAGDRVRVLWPIALLGTADALARCEPPSPSRRR